MAGKNGGKIQNQTKTKPNKNQDRMGRNKHVIFEYGHFIDAGNGCKRCAYCSSVYTGSVTNCVDHLALKHDVDGCQPLSKEQREKLKAQKTLHGKSIADRASEPVSKPTRKGQATLTSLNFTLVKRDASSDDEEMAVLAAFHDNNIAFNVADDPSFRNLMRVACTPGFKWERFHRKKLSVLSKSRAETSECSFCRQAPAITLF
jgi:hypothetical protein